MRSMWTKLMWRRLHTGRRAKDRPRPFAPQLEQLGDRVVPAVTATFNAAAGALVVTGDDADNAITIGRNAAGTICVNGGAVTIDGDVPTVANTSAVVVSGLGGNDTISLDETTGALPAATLLGGDGNDTLTGGAGDDQLLGEAGNDALFGRGGADTLLGDDGDDTIDGDQGNDTALLGDGNDTFTWDPGDGSDTVEGEAGADRMLFNGSGGAELFEASANGERVVFTRNLGGIVMDLNDVEAIDLNALGGIDSVTVNDLSGTDLTQFNANLGTDGAADTIVVNGTNGNDVITVSGTGPNAQVVGLSATVNITGAEPANDLLRVRALDGNDVIEASQLVAPAIQFIADGGAGNNTIVLPGGVVPLVAGADNVSVTEDSKANVLGVLANDTFVPGPGAALTIVSVSKPANGTATIAPDGKSIVYTPNVNFVGTDTFSYTITDGRGGTATATVTVNVADRPDGAFAIGFGPGGPAVAVLLDANTGAPKVIVDAFPGFFGGVSVATGDVNADGTPDLIAAAGPGGGGLVRVFDGTNGNLLTSFFAVPGFQGGLSVASGDINGDRFADIIVGTASGIGVVGIFSGRDQSLLGAFLPFGVLPLGLNVASGDVNGDGRDDIVAGTAFGIGVVGVFSGRDLSTLNLFLPLGLLPIGLNVAARDVNSDGFADLVLGTTSGIGFVRELNGRDMTPLASFFPMGFAPVGMRVAAEDMNGDGRSDIITGTASGPAIVKTFDARDSSALDFGLSFGGGSLGGVFVG